MKLKVKPSIRISPHSYKVCFTPDLIVTDEMRGQLNHYVGTLTIDTHLRLTQKEVTFWHEVLHGIDRNFSLHMTEDAIDNVAVGLTQFLQDNFDIELDFSEITIKGG